MRLWISSREIRPVSNSLFLQPRRLRTKYSQHGMNAHQSRGANQMTSDLTHCVTGAQLDLRGDNNTLGVILSSSTVKGLRRSSGSALKVPASSHLVHLLCNDRRIRLRHRLADHRPNPQFNSAWLLHVQQPRWRRVQGRRVWRERGRCRRWTRRRSQAAGNRDYCL